MLSEILADVSGGRHKIAPGQKRRSLTPKIEPMVRKKRRKTMVNLPQREDSVKLQRGDDEISLSYVTKGILAKKENLKDEENKENCPSTPNSKSHRVLERITTTPTRTPPPAQRRHSLSGIRTKRVSFDGLFKMSPRRPENFISPVRRAATPEVKNFYKMVKEASTKTKDIP